jgi:hypothetical protein
VKGLRVSGVTRVHAQVQVMWPKCTPYPNTQGGNCCDTKLHPVVARVQGRVLQCCPRCPGSRAQGALGVCVHTAGSKAAGGQH